MISLKREENMLIINCVRYYVRVCLYTIAFANWRNQRVVKNCSNILISGRSLVRLGENSLLRLGVVHPEHRQAILRAVAKLRLRSNIVLLRDIERKQ